MSNFVILLAIISSFIQTVTPDQTQVFYLISSVEFIYENRYRSIQKSFVECHKSFEYQKYAGCIHKLNNTYPNYVETLNSFTDYCDINSEKIECTFIPACKLYANDQICPEDKLCQSNIGLTYPSYFCKTQAELDAEIKNNQTSREQSFDGDQTFNLGIIWPSGNIQNFSKFIENYNHQVGDHKKIEIVNIRDSPIKRFLEKVFSSDFLIWVFSVLLLLVFIFGTIFFYRKSKIQSQMLLSDELILDEFENSLKNLKSRETSLSVHSNLFRMRDNSQKMSRICSGLNSRGNSQHFSQVRDEDLTPTSSRQGVKVGCHKKVIFGL